MKYIYLVHEVNEIDITHEEDIVIRAFTTFKDACACMEELKKKRFKNLLGEFECGEYYISQIKLEGDL